MRHSYPIGGFGLVGNLSRFSPLRDVPAQAAPEPTYRVKATQSIEDLFKLGEAIETGDFTDANLDLD